MKKIGYIQTTSKLQIEEQSELLISNGCTKIYVETSTKLNYQDKQKLQLAIDSLVNGDVLAVTRLSILCISVQSLLEVMYELDEKNISLEVVQQNFTSKNTHTTHELLFYLMEFIEDVKEEKQSLGLQDAKQKGKLGRPPKLTAKQVIKAIELKNHQTSKEVANSFKVGRSTLLRHISKHKKAS